MEWNDKIELCTLLNNGNYAEAVEFIRNKDIDPQAMDMFITGFYLTKFQMLQPIKDIILSYDSSLSPVVNNLRSILRDNKFKSIYAAGANDYSTEKFRLHGNGEYLDVVITFSTCPKTE